ncbi:hypothetical protein GCM10011375_13450 [Hymenobacter qilianensis]|uniref:Uncharacterized protein n=2 Tax=Hymenobacter qilianensis TaxID=1385715 RepID=A0ACB5PPU1_9BACT|nr:hypothetical protein [Hymenobacter qilianensis]QNP53119.1 hypothetical protein H9L05_05530 [Hymenobacter qilianensis]GGF59574.1 hypothetical protein GCM10011375_13450 [Hymenobacter qilianensis]
MQDSQNRSSNDFFWPSYVDLMTSLFVVMLVLFVYSFKLFKDREKELQQANGELKAKAEELEQITKIRRSLQRLEGKYFRYDPNLERHELLVPVQFKAGQDEIQDAYKPALLQAGKTLRSVLKTIKTEQPVRYLVIVEGMAARYAGNDARNRTQEQLTYQLSYRRALNLLNFWKQNGLNFSQDSNIELIIGGSGFYGTGRYRGAREGDNKRFLIQVIPKIGRIGGQKS